MAQAPEQLLLALNLDKTATFANFFGEQSAKASQILQAALLAGSEPFVLLHGAKGCGKTHLCSALVNEGEAILGAIAYLSGGELSVLPKTDRLEMLSRLEPSNGPTCLVIDDVDALLDGPESEQALFNLFNRYMMQAGRLVLSVSAPVSALGIQLPDLVSRLQSGLVIRLASPSEMDFKAILVGMAKQRGMRLDDAVSEYIYARSARSISALHETLDQLDHASSVEKRALTVPFVKKVLGF